MTIRLKKITSERNSIESRYHHTSFETKVVMNSVSKQLGKTTGNVLDFGCGTAVFAQVLLNENSTYYGLDIDYQVLKSVIDCDSRDNNNKKQFFVNAENVPFRTASFDLLFCFHVLEHLREADVHKTVREFHRVLKSSGMLVIGLPIMGPVGKIAFSLRSAFMDIDSRTYIDHTRDETHKSIFSFNDIITILEDAGFVEFKEKRLSNFRMVNILSRFFNVENEVLVRLILRFYPLFDVLCFLHK